MATRSVTSQVKLALVVLLTLCPLGAFGFESDTIVVRWNNTALQAIRETHSGPAQARILSMAHTCMYDAWAAYDVQAFGTRLDSQLRRPASEATIENKTKAISYADHRWTYSPENGLFLIDK